MHSEPATISPAWIVGFVGHRLGINEAILGPVIERELLLLDKRVAASGGTLHMCSSIAEGADLLALDCAERAGLPLHIMLPLPEEGFVRTISNPTDQVRARARMSAIREQPQVHSWRLAATSMRVPDAYYETDICLVEAADFFLVVWDGLPERGLGGTAQVVDLARAKGMPLIWIHKDTAQVVYERMPNSHGLDPVLAKLSEMGTLTLCRQSLTEINAVRASMTNLEKNLEVVAGHDANWFRRAAALFFGFNLLAALLGSLSAVLPHATVSEKVLVAVLGVLECALVVWALSFKLGKKRRLMRDDWIFARFGAELLRSLAASRCAIDPLQANAWSANAVHAKASRLPDWRRFILSTSLYYRAGAAQRDWQQLRDAYAERLENQRSYFARNARVPYFLEWMDRTTDRYGWVVVLVILVAFGNRLMTGPWLDAMAWKLVLGVLPVLLPLLVTLPSTVIAAFDYDRRAIRYAVLAEKLQGLIPELAKMRTEDSFRRFVTNTEQMLQAEIAEWYFATSRVDP